MLTGWRRPVAMADHGEECKKEFRKLKDKKKYRYMILRIMGGQPVIVRTENREKKIEDLKSYLKQSFCRYVIYDYHEPDASPEDSKIFFITWCPPDAWMSDSYKRHAKEHSKVFDDTGNFTYIEITNKEDLNSEKLKGHASITQEPPSPK